MRFFLAVCAAIIAFPAFASTYRIDVSGEFQSVQLNQARHADGTSSDIRVRPGDLPYYDFLAATSGSAIFDGSVYTSCTGMLVPMCRRNSFVQGFKVFGFPDEMMEVTPGSIRYQTDIASLRFTSEGQEYYGFMGLSAETDLKSFSITQVPLPAGAILLLTALGLLHRVRRRHLA